jgi:hypothetical protein
VPSPTLTEEERKRFDQLEPLRQRLTQVCTEDQWPTAVTDCVMNAEDPVETNRCFETLPKELQDHIARAVDETIRR